jgi:glycosyltransferase 2 family protein
MKRANKMHIRLYKEATIIFRGMKEFWSNYSKYIRITGTGFLLIILFLKVDAKEAIRLFSEVNVLVLIPLFLYPIGIWLSSLKWKIALGNKSYSLIKLCRIYWISNFFSNFLPSTVGGDSYKLVKLKGEFGYRKTIYSIFLDRGTGLFTILLILTFSSIFTYNLTENPYLSFIPALIIVGYFTLNLLKPKYLQDVMAVINGNREVNLKLILISFPFIALGAISLWTYYFMYGYNLDIFTVLIFYCLVQLIAMIPISINGWGLNEGSLVYLFSLLGVPIAVSLSIAILSRIAMFFVTWLGGISYLFGRTYPRSSNRSNFD